MHSRAGLRKIKDSQRMVQIILMIYNVRSIRWRRNETCGRRILKREIDIIKIVIVAMFEWFASLDLC